jgi:hypothetical protein
LRDSWDLAHDIVERLEVLDVDRVSTVMPASRSSSMSCHRLAFTRAGHVRVRQLVNERDGGRPGDDRIDVHLGELSAAILHLSSRHDLESTQQGFGDGPAVRLDKADDNICAA